MDNKEKNSQNSSEDLDSKMEDALSDFVIALKDLPSDTLDEINSMLDKILEDNK